MSFPILFFSNLQAAWRNTQTLTATSQLIKTLILYNPCCTPHSYSRQTGYRTPIGSPFLIPYFFLFSQNSFIFSTIHVQFNKVLLFWSMPWSMPTTTDVFKCLKISFYTIYTTFTDIHYILIIYIYVSLVLVLLSSTRRVISPNFNTELYWKHKPRSK